MSKKTISKLVLFLVVVLLGILIGGMAMSIVLKNKEIATLKEEIERSNSDRFKDLLRFGQWKLKVEEMADKNGWQLPEMSDSVVLMVDGPSFEGHIEAEVDGDSIHVINKSTKILQEDN